MAAPTAQPAGAAVGADAYAPQLRRLVLFSYFLSGAVALAFQVVWIRALVFSFDVMRNTTYAFSGMLTVFLIGLALGSWLMTARVDREKDPLRLYSLLLIGIGLSGALSYFLIHFVAPGWTPSGDEMRSTTTPAARAATTTCGHTTKPWRASTSSTWPSK